MIGFSEIYRRALPLALANMSLVALTFTDMVMLGQHEMADMAASSVAMQAYIIILFLGEGLVFGFSSLYGRHIGDKGSTAWQRVITSLLLLILAYSLIGGVILSQSGWVTDLLDQPEALARDARFYIILLGIALLPNLLFAMCWELLAFEEREPLVLLGGALQLVVNILANYVFIYGFWIVPSYGLVGAGFATVISSVFGCLFLISGFLLFNRKHLVAARVFSLDLDKVREDLIAIIRVGVPIGLATVVTMGFFAFSVFLMTRFGTEVVAAHSAAMQVNELIVVFGFGFGEFTAIYFASQGETAPFLPRHLLRRILHAASLLFLPLLMVGFFMRDQLAYIFFDRDAPDFSQASELITLFAQFSIPSLFVVLVLMLVQSALRGRGITAMPAFLIFASYWLFGVPLQLLLLWLFPTAPIVVWISFGLSFSLAALLLFVLFLREEKRGRLFQRA